MADPYEEERQAKNVFDIAAEIERQAEANRVKAAHFDERVRYWLQLIEHERRQNSTDTFIISWLVHHLATVEAEFRYFQEL